jgi:hypothetical protein
MSDMFPFSTDQRPCPNCNRDCSNIVNCVSNLFNTLNIMNKMYNHAFSEIQTLKANECYNNKNNVKFKE